MFRSSFSPHQRVWLTVIVLGLLVTIVVRSGLTVHSQNPQEPTFYGQTQTVVLRPFGAVNAGPFFFTMDTDHDGMSDACETANGFNPNDPTDADLDADHDGLTNGDECALGTNPRIADTDGDGFNDGAEVQQGYDPLDPNSHPTSNSQFVRIQVTPTTIALSLNPPLPSLPRQMTVQGELPDGSMLDITHNPATHYLSLNPAFAAVDDQGSIVAVAAGTTVVRVSNGTLTTEAAVLVTTIPPGPEGQVTLPGFANNVKIKGTFALVACGLAGLQVVDISNPAQARIAGSLGIPGNAGDLQVVGDVAFLAQGPAGLAVVSVADPINPQLLTMVPVGNAVDVVVRNGFAYVATVDQGLVTVDVQNPATANQIGALAFPPGLVASGVDADAERGLVVLTAVSSQSGTGVMVVVSVSNPATPVVRSQLLLATNQVADVTVNGMVAYISQQTGLTTVNLANPDTPQVLGTVTNIGAAVDIAVRGGLAFEAVQPQVLGSPGFVANYQVTAPTSPQYLGSLSTGFGYRSGTGIAVTDSLIFTTAARLDNYFTFPGVSGDTVLFITRYAQQDGTGTPPTVALTSPPPGVTIFTGESVTVEASAADDVAVALVEFRANGTLIGTDATPPYRVTYTVPAGVTSVRFEARASDFAQNSTDAAPVMVSVVPNDPLTTVTGTVVTQSDTPIVGATVTLDQFGTTTTTDAGGNFTFGGVPTVPLGVRVSVTAEDAASGLKGKSGSVVTVRGGVTEIGTVRLVTSRTTPLPALLSALGVGPILGAGRDDLFIGFSDRASKVYAAGANGQFAVSGSYSLPFGAVRSGTGIGLDAGGTFDLLAQPVGQNGNLTAVFSNGTGGVSGSSPLATGLAGESEITVAGEDFPHMVGSRPVVVTATVTGGTTLTVRVGDGNGNLLNPITLPVSASIPVRAIQVVDVTGDQLADVAGIEEVAPGETRFFVIPRIGPTTFGTLVESAITTRSLTPSFGTVDYALGNYDQSSGVKLTVLGNDRVRIYSGDGAGRFTPVQEIPLPAGTSALGIAQLQDSGGNRLAVLVKETAAPLVRTLLLYGQFDAQNTSYRYTAMVDTNDARVVFGDFDADNTSADVALIDEQSITTFLNVGGQRPQQKSRTEVPVQGFPLTSRLFCRTAGFRMKF